MTPLVFGARDRRLFGIYDAAVARRGPPRAAVLCPAFGEEQQRSYRAMRQLALRLAGDGWDVLRFDYHGTGDSAGEFAEARLEGWREDIVTAMEEAQDMSGADTIALVGLRLGATLGSDVTMKHSSDICALVRWEPIDDGPQHLDELTRRHRENYDEAPRTRAGAAGGGVELLGFPVNAALLADLQAIQPPATLSVRHSLTIRNEDAASPNGSENVAVIPEAPAWLEERYTGAGALPIATLQHIITWLGEQA